jgi:hypothetical protein
MFSIEVKVREELFDLANYSVVIMAQEIRFIEARILSKVLIFVWI